MRGVFYFALIFCLSILSIAKASFSSKPQINGRKITQENFPSYVIKAWGRGLGMCVGWGSIDDR